MTATTGGCGIAGAFFGSGPGVLASSFLEVTWTRPLDYSKILRQAYAQSGRGSTQLEFMNGICKRMSAIFVAFSELLTCQVLACFLDLRSGELLRERPHPILVHRVYSIAGHTMWIHVAYYGRCVPCSFVGQDNAPGLRASA